MIESSSTCRSFGTSRMTACRWLMVALALCAVCRSSAISYRCADNQVLIVQSFGNDTIRMHCQRLNLCGNEKLHCNYDYKQKICGGKNNFVAHVNQLMPIAPVNHTCCELRTAEDSRAIAGHDGNDCFVYELPDGMSAHHDEAAERDRRIHKKDASVGEKMDSSYTLLRSADQIPMQFDGYVGYRMKLFFLKNKSPPTLVVKAIERVEDGYRVTICRPRCGRFNRESEVIAVEEKSGDDQRPDEWAAASWSSWTSSTWTAWSTTMWNGTDEMRTRGSGHSASTGPVGGDDGGASVRAAASATAMAGKKGQGEGAGQGAQQSSGGQGPNQPANLSVINNINVSAIGGHAGEASRALGNSGSAQPASSPATTVGVIRGAIPEADKEDESEDGDLLGNGNDKKQDGKGKKPSGSSLKLNGEKNGDDEDEAGKNHGKDGKTGKKKKGKSGPSDGDGDDEDAENSKFSGKKPNGRGNGKGRETGRHGGRNKKPRDDKHDWDSDDSDWEDSGEDYDYKLKRGQPDARKAGRKGGHGNGDQNGFEASGENNGDGDESSPKKSGQNGGKNGEGAGEGDESKNKKSGNKGGTNGNKLDQAGGKGKEKGKGKKGGDSDVEDKPDATSGNGNGNDNNRSPDGQDGQDGGKSGGAEDPAAGKGKTGKGKGGKGNAGKGKGETGKSKGDRKEGKNEANGKNAGPDGADGNNSNHEDGGDGNGNGKEKKPGPGSEENGTDGNGKNGKDGEEGKKKAGKHGKRLGGRRKHGIGKNDENGGDSDGKDGDDDGEEKGKKSKGHGKGGHGKKGGHGNGFSSEKVSTSSTAASINGGDSDGSESTSTGFTVPTDNGSTVDGDNFNSSHGPKESTTTAADGSADAEQRQGDPDGFGDNREGSNVTGNGSSEPSRSSQDSNGKDGSAGSVASSGAIDSPSGAGSSEKSTVEAKGLNTVGPDTVGDTDGSGEEAGSGEVLHDDGSGEKPDGSGENDVDGSEILVTNKLIGGDENSSEEAAARVAAHPANDAHQHAQPTASNERVLRFQPMPNADPAQMQRSCFSADTVVRTPTGWKAMNHLNVGDMVLVPFNITTFRYQPVEMFYHREPDTYVKFVHIETRSGRSLSLTPLHLLPFGDCAQLRASDLDSTAVEQWMRQSRFAHKAAAEDCLLAVDDVEGRLVVDEISKVGRRYSRGIYSPMTVDGSLLAGGVLSSCFSQLESHTIQKLAYDLIYRIYHLFGYISIDVAASRNSIADATSQVQAVPQLLDYIHQFSRYIVPFAKY